MERRRERAKEREGEREREREVSQISRFQTGMKNLTLEHTIKKGVFKLSSGLI